MAEMGSGPSGAQAGPLPGALSSPRSRLAAEEARASAAMALDRAEGAGGDCNGDGGAAFQGSNALLDVPAPPTPPPPLPSHDLLLFSLEVSWLSDDGPYVFTGAALFSAVAALIGAWSVLFSKSLTYVLAELPEALGDWYTWFVVVAFFATAAFWVRQSDQGLRLYPAALIMPLMHAWWMCMSVLEGGIYFDELATLGTGPLVALLTGLFLALVGALSMGLAGFLAERQASPSSPPASRERKDARKFDAALSPVASAAPAAALSQDAERVDVRRRQL
ncbi:hypothetical protein H632_c3024p0 [Helicosporidium sp. ATCC 50920]|nr:hypothetical protein H632_c3024p0 [Helicosporidium sp. ATCC 50920]|eukprot:KDD72687.1 hypothetical protein H632_c3024p0 [Helicosporidium sp. ATCC 50920]